VKTGFSLLSVLKIVGRSRRQRVNQKEEKSGYSICDPFSLSREGFTYDGIVNFNIGQ
jgi:hypothetical protein